MKQTNNKNNNESNKNEWVAACLDDDNDDSGEKGGTKVTKANGATPIDSPSDNVHNKDSQFSSAEVSTVALRWG